MDWPGILSDLVNDLQPESVPIEFIICARYYDEHGTPHLVTGAELAQFMAHGTPVMHHTQVILDRRKIHHAMCVAVAEFFADLDRT